MNTAEKLDYSNLQPGIYEGIPADIYHRLPFVSNSYLKKLDKVPAAAKIEQKETPALIIGRAIHAFTLEGPAAFSREFAVLPDGIDRRTKAGKEEYELFLFSSSGRNVITSADFDMVKGVSAAVHAHPFAKVLLGEGVSETTVIFDRVVNGQTVRCKCRPDRTPSPDMQVLLDLKSTQDAGYDKFLRSCLSYGYINQAALYVDGYNAVRGDLPEIDAFAFIAVEKEEPYRVEVYTVDQDFLMHGRREYQRLLEVEMACRARNFWPNFINAGADTLMMPAWLQTAA